MEIELDAQGVDLGPLHVCGLTVEATPLNYKLMWWRASFGFYELVLAYCHYSVFNRWMAGVFSSTALVDAAVASVVEAHSLNTMFAGSFTSDQKPVERPLLLQAFPYRPVAERFLQGEVVAAITTSQVRQSNELRVQSWYYEQQQLTAGIVGK